MDYRIHLFDISREYCKKLVHQHLHIGMKLYCMFPLGHNVSQHNKIQVELFHKGMKVDCKTLKRHIQHDYCNLLVEEHQLLDIGM